LNNAETSGVCEGRKTGLQVGPGELGWRERRKEEPEGFEETGKLGEKLGWRRVRSL
jgi:hypothetical protein